MAILLFVVGTRDLSIGQWLAGALGGLLCGFAVLLATREVSLNELRSLGRFVTQTRAHR
jgi:hypothetical protein